MKKRTSAAWAVALSLVLSFSPLAPVGRALAEEAEQDVPGVGALADEADGAYDEGQATVVEAEDAQGIDATGAADSGEEEESAVESDTEQALDADSDANQADEANSDAAVPADASSDSGEASEPLLAAAEEKQTPVRYIDADGVEQTVDSYTILTPDATSLSGWVVVSEDVYFPSTLSVNGDAHLILCNGAKLTVNLAILVSGDASLTVYGQAGNAGELDAAIHGGMDLPTGTITINGGTISAESWDSGVAAIGGGVRSWGGNVIINGGKVTATSNNRAAAIGGGHQGSGGTIIINGGEVTAISNREYGAGIGGGYYGSGGTITINGGVVTAVGAAQAAGIGGGGEDNGGCNGGTITINGGVVNATGGRKGAGIGDGWKASGSIVTINGGQVTATGTDGGAGIGCGADINSGEQSQLSVGFSSQEDYLLVDKYANNRGFYTSVSADSLKVDGTYGKVYFGNLNDVEQNLPTLAGQKLVWGAFGVTIRINKGSGSITLSENYEGVPEAEAYPARTELIYAIKADENYSCPSDTVRITTAHGVDVLTYTLGNDEFFLEMPADDVTIEADFTSESSALNVDTNEYYPTIEEAIASVADGQTIRLLNDISYTGAENNLTIQNRPAFTLDLNGHTIEADISHGGRGTVRVVGGGLTVMDSSSSQVGEILNTGGGNALHATMSDLKIEGGRIVSPNLPAVATADGGIGIVSLNGNLTVQGGYIEGYFRGVYFSAFNESTATISGGTIVANQAGKSVGNDINAEGYMTPVQITGGQFSDGSGNDEGFVRPEGMVLRKDSGEEWYTLKPEGGSFDDIKYEASLSLNDYIGVNFYINKLPASTSPNQYTVKWWTYDEADAKEVTLKDSDQNYLRLADFAAREMSDQVHVRVYHVNQSEPIKSIDYSVRDYCDWGIEQGNQKLAELCQAVLDYGTSAQLHFSYKLSDLANKNHSSGMYQRLREATVPDTFKATSTGACSLTSRTAASLSLESQVAMNLYLTPAKGTSSEDIALAVDGTSIPAGTTTEISGATVTRKTLSDGRSFVAISGISPTNFDHAFVFTIGSGSDVKTITCSPLSYAYNMQTTLGTLGDLSHALYAYHTKAKAYL